LEMRLIRMVSSQDSRLLRMLQWGSNNDLILFICS
jgi:hypothetical protein